MARPKGKIFNRPISANYLSVGEDVYIDGDQVTIEMLDSEGNIVMCQGNTVPSAVSGFSKAGLFRKFDASGDGLYRNVGTTSSCSFEKIDTVIPSEITIADGNSFDDSGGLEVLAFGVTASAVNEVTITNAATGNGPIVSATGGDTDIDLNLTPKGDAGVIVNVGTEQGLMINSTTDTATGGGLLLMQESASPAADDTVGVVQGLGRDDAASEAVYGSVAFVIDDPAAGSTAGAVIISGVSAGAEVEGIGVGGVDIALMLPVLMDQTEQALSGAGAVDVTSQTTNWDCSGAVAGTLADGESGQLKFIYCGTYVGNGTLTPSNLLGYSTITFTAVGQSCLLQFNGTNWVVVSSTATLA